jgi:hypothetical protein
MWLGIPTAAGFGTVPEQYGRVPGPEATLLCPPRSATFAKDFRTPLLTT